LINTCPAALHLVLSERFPMVSLAGRSGSGAAGSEREARGDRPDGQLRSRDHGCVPSVPAAAGRPRRTSRTRHRCDPAAVLLPGLRNPGVTV
jgi:hypothetical protein